MKLAWESSVAALLTLGLVACQTGRRPAEPSANPEDGPALDARGSASAAPRSLPVPSYLPPSARALLGEQMQRHGDDMAELLWAVVFLDHETVTEIARVMEHEPRFARPIARDATELNTRLPPEYFEQQDALVVTTRALAAAAAAGDDQVIADAYADLAKTCVQCHFTYLAPKRGDAKGAR